MNTKNFMNMAMGIFIICCFTVMAAAQDELDLGSRTPTMEEITNAFAPEPAKKTKKYTTRGFEPAPKSVEKPKSISMEIKFEKNSFQLTSKAQETLDVVGQAFNTNELGKSSFTIEGHTDASGDNSYNLKLSQQRAEAVKAYLIKRQHVTSGRLDTVGKGETELLDQGKPYSSRNRRVRIISAGN